MIKVVKEIDGKLLSTTITPYSLEYPLNEWVYPKIGKIFVFDNIENAKLFVNPPFRNPRPSDKYLACYKVEVKNPVSLPYCAMPNIYIDLFWHNYEIGKESNAVYIAATPQGTYICDAVKLIEKINDELMGHSEYHYLDRMFTDNLNHDRMGNK